MCNKRLIIPFCQELLHTNLDLRLYLYMLSEFSLIPAFQCHFIFTVIFICKGIYISFRYSVHISYQLIYIIMIDFPAEFNLCLYLVSFSNGYIVHIVPETAYADMGRFHYTDSCSHPAPQLLLYLSVCPMSYDDLSLDSHTAYDMTIFSVPMSGLVFVHEVHVHCIVGNFFIKLRMQMAKRLFIFLKADDPHLCR